jgi:segregation and condensation protein A
MTFSLEEAPCGGTGFFTAEGSLATPQIMDYQVKLQIFEGPLDLLLHLIRKNEVDIFDIPIATIADQYLEYLDLMTALNISLAGDFLVMASTLIHIKSRMLLPAREGEGDEEDPRAELTRPLLEYLRFKEAAGELSERDLLARDVFTRPLAPDLKSEILSEEPLIELSLFQLIDAFKKVVEERLPGAQLQLELEQYSLKEKTSYVMDQLKARGSLHFTELFENDRTISELIITFLAILELVQMGIIRISQPEPYKDIKLEANFGEQEVNPHG